MYSATAMEVDDDDQIDNSFIPLAKGRNETFHKSSDRKGGSWNYSHTNFKTDRKGIDGRWAHDKFEENENIRPFHKKANKSVYVKNVMHVGRRLATPEPENRININNLHHNVVLEDLEEMFAPFEHTNIKLHHDSLGRQCGTADIYFNNVGLARKAMTHYDGFSLDGRELNMTLLTDEAVMSASQNASIASRLSIVLPKKSMIERVHRNPIHKKKTYNNNRSYDEKKMGMNKRIRNDIFLDRMADEDENSYKGRSKRFGQKDNGKNMKEKKHTKTVEELDKELESYMKKRPVIKYDE